MDVDELAKMVSRAYAESVDRGIFFGILTGRDVCVSTQGPFRAELVGGNGEYPSFHGQLPYVRYHVASSRYASNGGVESSTKRKTLTPEELGLRDED
jgi:hypothetical protein